jgi:hypothetical protein
MTMKETKAWILLTALYIDIYMEVLKKNRTITSRD